MGKLFASLNYPFCKVKRETFQDAHDRWVKSGKRKRMLMAAESDDNKNGDNTTVAKF